MEQFIYRLDNEGIIDEILREVTAIKDSNVNETTCNPIVTWTQKGELQRAQKKP